MKKLIYTKLADSVLAIDLHNGYTVIVMKTFNYDEEKYKATFYIKDNTVDTIELMERQENIEFIADKKTINSVILKHVGLLLQEGFFDYYIERYAYMIKCFEKGNELFEKERLNSRNDNNE